MNAVISNTDTAVADDIAGARALYDSGTVVTAPTITTQPTSRSAAVGTSTTFTVVATGTAPLTYQWRRNGSDLAAATAASFTVSSVTTADAGTYTVTVTNSADTATSNGAVLTVTTAAVAPSITTQPSGQSVTAGAAVSFSVVATGTAPLTCQWRQDGAAIAGATSADLLPSPAPPPPIAAPIPL